MVDFGRHSSQTGFFEQAPGRIKQVALGDDVVKDVVLPREEMKEAVGGGGQIGGFSVRIKPREGA